MITHRASNPSTEPKRFKEWLDDKLVEVKKKTIPKKIPDKMRMLEFVYLSDPEYNNLIS